MTNLEYKKLNINLMILAFIVFNFILLGVFFYEDLWQRFNVRMSISDSELIAFKDWIGDASWECVQNVTIYTKTLEPIWENISEECFQKCMYISNQCTIGKCHDNICTIKCLDGWTVTEEIAIKGKSSCLVTCAESKFTYTNETKCVKEELVRYHAI